MEYVERPLLGSGEPVHQDLSLGAGEEPPQEDGGYLLVSCPQHGQSVRVPKHPPSSGIAVHYVKAVTPVTQREGHILCTRTAQLCLNLGHQFEIPLIAIATGQGAWDGSAVGLASHLGRRVHG